MGINDSITLKSGINEEESFLSKIGEDVLRMQYFSGALIAALLFGISCPAQALPGNTSTGSSLSDLPGTSSSARKSRRLADVADGPLKTDREAIRSWLVKARKRGVGIKGYLTVYNDMESAVRAGKSEAEVKAKLERIQRSIGDQYNQSRKLQSPLRKVPKRGSRSQKSGKVDINYGRNRYWTPHEIKRSCDRAEHEAILRTPDLYKNDIEVQQDLRRQRDERERLIMRRHGFRERDFTRNPHRYKDTGRVGAGGAGSGWGAW